MSRHDDFLSELLSRLPGQLFLVNRFAEDSLGLPEDGVLRVFIPDLHLMSSESEDAFTYRFNGFGGPPGGSPLFEALLSALSGATKNRGDLEVYQLGDRYDLWREAIVEFRSKRPIPDPAVLRDRIRSDPRIAPLLARLEAFSFRALRGNHDHLLATLDERPGESPAPEEMAVAGGRLLLTHGHRWDKIENLLPDDVKEWGVRIYPRPRVSAYGIGFHSPKQVASFRVILGRRRAFPDYPVFPDLRPQGPRLLRTAGDAVRVGSLAGASLDVRAFSHAPDGLDDFETRDSILEFGWKIWKAEQENTDLGAARRVYVFGHTHRARLLVDEHPLLGGPLVSMDCGGWVENCQIRDEETGGTYAVPSAQVAVQCGNDLRIYQLGGALRAVRPAPRAPRSRAPRPPAPGAAAPPRRRRGPRSRRKG